MNKIGIYYAFWTHDWDADFHPYVDKVADLGFDILEVNGGTIVNGDHNTPPQTIKDVEQLKAVRSYCKEHGITKLYDRDGIGHVVNVEKGDLIPGKLFVSIDPQAANAGAVESLLSAPVQVRMCFLDDMGRVALVLV